MVSISMRNALTAQIVGRIASVCVWGGGVGGRMNNTKTITNILVQNMRYLSLVKLINFCLACEKYTNILQEHVSFLYSITPVTA
jgi:hypothetical protein